MSETMTKAFPWSPTERNLQFVIVRSIGIVREPNPNRNLVRPHCGKVSSFATDDPGSGQIDTSGEKKLWLFISSDALAVSIPGNPIEPYTGWPAEGLMLQLASVAVILRQSLPSIRAAIFNDAAAERSLEGARAAFSRNDAGYRVGGAHRNVVQGISQVGQHAEVVIIGRLD